jgi:hypothetical protein
MATYSWPLPLLPGQRLRTDRTFSDRERGPRVSLNYLTIPDAGGGWLSHWDFAFVCEAQFTTELATQVSLRLSPLLAGWIPPAIT